MAPTASAKLQSWIAPWSSAVLCSSEPDQRLLGKRRHSMSKQHKPMSRSLSDAKSGHALAFTPSSEMSAPAPPTLQRIFFSPHPDDIAYSAYGTASRPPRCCHHEEKTDVPMHSPSMSSSSSFSDDATLIASTPSSSSTSSTSGSRRNSAANSNVSLLNGQNALIVTVFSKSRCANGEIGARLNRDVEATTTLRADEDHAFARSIGCDLLQLGFPDSSARDEPSRRPDLAEAVMKGAPGSKLRHVDHYIYEDVRRALEPIVWMAIRAGAKIHLPLGVGCHVDHWMVRVAVLSILDELDVKLSTASTMMSEPLRNIFSTHLVGGQEPLHERLIFYEDLPYADAQTNDHIEKLALSVLPRGAKAQLVHLSESDWCKKRAAVLAYASQMKPTILPSLYNHATRLAQRGKAIDPDWALTARTHLAAERIWIIDAELRRRALLEERQQALEQRMTLQTRLHG